MSTLTVRHDRNYYGYVLRAGIEAHRDHQMRASVHSQMVGACLNGAIEAGWQPVGQVTILKTRFAKWVEDDQLFWGCSEPEATLALFTCEVEVRPTHA